MLYRFAILVLAISLAFTGMPAAHAASPGMSHVGMQQSGDGSQSCGGLPCDHGKADRKSDQGDAALCCPAPSATALTAPAKGEYTLVALPVAWSLFSDCDPDRPVSALDPRPPRL